MKQEQENRGEQGGAVCFDRSGVLYIAGVCGECGRSGECVGAESLRGVWGRFF